ncbi:class I SAM-dependent methyltransferase [Anabaena sphaerica FACHB-251]|uniref:Class I SAM-dependent methyltransferase n=1 Tax=Anabaena sphaerica FACHB-251 TaxID=2692883 RepID=A0A926WCR1_9NOST|nr:class I SAM-dependent methyltransferase [Anabaena sphaerica]MBD2291993.1 class I SAM-dependent methyltransferase [Anabaena sphaerica FACHB-251]
MLPTQVQLESKPCPICSKFDDEVILTGRDRLHNLPGKFTVVRCRSCSLMRTNPRPTPETIGYYYPDDYGPYQFTKVSKNEKQNLPLSQKITQRIFEFNERRLPSLPPGRMLEVGCASGDFLHKMANQGWEVEGIEFSEKAAQTARSLGYKVHIGSLEIAPKPEQKYDLVVAWMVLEHLHDPILGLTKLQSWVKPGGWLAVSVPNIGSLEFKIFKDAWYALQIPTHLYHYNPNTLSQVLEHSGWKMEKVLHHRLLDNIIASLSYLLKDININPQLSSKLIDYSTTNKYKYLKHRISRLIYPLSFTLSLCGQTGRMTVWAKRVN